MINPMDLTGKQVMLTGAGAGIGQETAVVLSRLGASLTLMDINEEGLAETMSMVEAPERHKAYPIDLFYVERIEPDIRKMISESGPFDGFVHCAGIAPMRPLYQTKPYSFDLSLRVNLISFVEIVRILTKAKKGFKDGGSIVAMSSTGSIHGKPAKTAYSASKAGLDAAIRCMTAELKDRRIRINSVMPNWVRTKMYDTFMANYPDSPELKELQEKQYLGITEPCEVANTIAFLLSNATRTITGTTILMDGGALNG